MVYCEDCERNYKNINSHYTSNKHLNNMFQKCFIKEIQKGNLYPELSDDERKILIDNGNPVLRTIPKNEGDERMEFRGKTAYSDIYNYIMTN